MHRFTERRVFALIAVLALFAFAGAGCGDSDEPKPDTSAAGGFTAEAGKERNPADVKAEKENFSNNPPPVQLLSNNQSGIVVSKPTVKIARTNKQFNAIIKEHFAKGIDKQNVAGSDFKERMVVAVILPKSDPGTLVQVADIQKKGGKVVVRAFEVVPGDNCGTGKGTFRPISIVETAAMSGDAKLELETQKAADC